MGDMVVPVVLFVCLLAWQLHTHRHSALEQQGVLAKAAMRVVAIRNGRYQTTDVKPND